MLLQVVALVDGALHLFLAVVDGHDGEVVERLYRRLAPEDVAAFLQWPVAEGNNDVVVLQSLRLVDGEDAYAAGLVALDGL